MAKIAMPQTRNLPAGQAGGAARRSPETRSSNDLTEIEKLAYQFFVERGYQHGHQEEDWLRAEAIIKSRKRL